MGQCVGSTGSPWGRGQWPISLVAPPRRLRAGLCDRCVVTQELARKKQREFEGSLLQSLQHIFILSEALPGARPPHLTVHSLSGSHHDLGSSEAARSARACPHHSWPHCPRACTPDCPAATPFPSAPSLR